MSEDTEEWRQGTGSEKPLTLVEVGGAGQTWRLSGEMGALGPFQHFRKMSPYSPKKSQGSSRTCQH